MTSLKEKSMYCNCMNIKTNNGYNYKGKFNIVDTDEDGACSLCGYYAMISPCTYEDNEEDHTLDKLIGGNKRLVSYWHKRTERNSSNAARNVRSKYDNDFKYRVVKKVSLSKFPIKRWAAKLGIKESLLKYWYVEYKGSVIRRKYQNDTIISMVENNCTPKEIHKVVNLSVKVIRKRIKKIYGIDVLHKSRSIL